MTEALVGRVLAEWDKPGAPGQPAPRSAAGGVLDRLQARADALWEVTQELAGYLDDTHGPRLLTSVSELHAAVRRVVDPVPGDAVPAELMPALVGTQLGEVIKATAPVASGLGSAYADLRRHVTDQDLRRRLEEQERTCTSCDRALEELLDAAATAAALARDSERSGAAFAASGQDLLVQLRQLVEAPDADEETVRLVTEALDQARGLTDGLLREMTDGPDKGKEPDDRAADRPHRP
jgi:hypothetical protein